MNLVEAKYLLDVNVLVALALGGHPHNEVVTRWFDDAHKMGWATCIVTEAGFFRVMINPKAGGQSLEESIEALQLISAQPGHSFWQMIEACSTLIAPFSGRLFGHQQVTDALLLGLAVKQNGILVTMDRTISHLAGSRYRQNLLVLEP